MVLEDHFVLQKNGQKLDLKESWNKNLFLFEKKYHSIPFFIGEALSEN